MVYNKIDWTKPVQTKENPPRRVTINGLNSSIVDPFCVDGSIDGSEEVQCWTYHGKYFASEDSELDLENIPVPAWQLPPPPLGRQWHRVDGWTEEMLPQGYRPLLVDETGSYEHSTFGEYWTPGSWETAPAPLASYCFYRTNRPLPDGTTQTQENHMKLKQPDKDGWIPHTPGDPMPCDGEMIVQVKFQDNSDCQSEGQLARFWKYGPWDNWSKERSNKKKCIIAWRPSKADALSQFTPQPETTPAQPPPATPPMLTQRTESILLTPPGEPIFAEAALRIKIEDEAAGEFLTFESLSNDGKLRLDPDEWPAFKAGVEFMLSEIEKHKKP